MNLTKLIKPILAALAALIYGLVCFINGTAKQKNQQNEEELNNAYQAKNIVEANSKLSRDDLINKL